MAAELDQPSLFRVQLQVELCESLAQLSHEPLGIRPVFEPHNEVVSEAHDDNVSLRLPLPPLLSPQVEYVVEVYVRKQRTDARPLRRSLVLSYSHPVLQHARFQPFLEMASDALVPDAVLDEPLQPSVVHGVERTHDTLPTPGTFRPRSRSSASITRCRVDPSTSSASLIVAAVFGSSSSCPTERDLSFRTHGRTLKCGRASCRLRPRPSVRSLRPWAP